MPPRLLRRHKVVRDLEWALASPPMLTASEGPLPSVVALATTQRWLAELDHTPQPLLDFIRRQQQQGKGTALGFYFGQLLEFWVRHCPALSPAAVRVGVPIKGQGQGRTRTATVGQLKLLVQHPRFGDDAAWTGQQEQDAAARGHSEELLQLYHWEASVKFFLRAPPPPSGRALRRGKKAVPLCAVCVRRAAWLR
jgi:hypothetical protein